VGTTTEAGFESINTTACLKNPIISIIQRRHITKHTEVKGKIGEKAPELVPRSMRTSKNTITTVLLKIKRVCRSKRAVKKTRNALDEHHALISQAQTTKQM
jgi:hypothetical protein